jgi:hypothetical protein
MGAASSLPSTLTREKVIELTQSTRSVMNVILSYMLKEISIRDFYDLSDPNKCKKYVLFLANTLDKTFYELRLTPIKDKSGILAFRTIKELIEPSESEKLERQSLCLILSYFYTRIFQIYGALALTLIDDASVMSDKGLLVQMPTTARLPTPGSKPFTAIGGSIPDLGVFNFAKTFIYGDNPSYDYGYRTKFPNYVIYFKRGASEGLSYSGIFTIGYRGAQNFFTLEINARSEKFDNSDVYIVLKKIRYSKKSGSPIISIDIPLELVGTKSFHILSQYTGLREREYSIKGSELSVPEYFESIFDKVVPYMRKLYGDDSYTEYTNDKPQYTSYKGYEASSTVKELDLNRILHNLQKEKPLGHCVARALQLLRNVPLKDQDGISYICKAKFMEGKDGLSRSGLPVPGSGLDTSPGLTALSLLFYDTVQYGSPKITMSNDSLAKYTEFMRNMAILFGDSPEGKQTLSSIKNKRDRELCGPIISDISVPTNITSKVYSYVNMLYKKQVEHSAKAGAIFNMLFNIKKDKSTGITYITLHENILKNGIPEINKINNYTRDVLVDYYKGCESIYIQGMKEVLDIRPTS